MKCPNGLIPSAKYTNQLARGMAFRVGRREYNFLSNQHWEKNQKLIFNSLYFRVKFFPLTCTKSKVWILTLHYAFKSLKLKMRTVNPKRMRNQNEFAFQKFHFQLDN